MRSTMARKGWRSISIVSYEVNDFTKKESLITFAVLRDELETTMRMCGVTDLSQVHPGLLNTRAVDHLIPDQEEHPYAKWRPKAKI